MKPFLFQGDCWHSDAISNITKVYSPSFDNPHRIVISKKYVKDDINYFFATEKECDRAFIELVADFTNACQ